MDATLLKDVNKVPFFFFLRNEQFLQNNRCFREIEDLKHDYSTIINIKL